MKRPALERTFFLSLLSFIALVSPFARARESLLSFPLLLASPCFGPSARDGARPPGRGSLVKLRP
eukprot:1431423-Lingulodinium_polyedra.AAC.1